MPLPTTTSRTNDPPVLADINTTPLIDVMLVLLIMLIITIPIQLHSINLNLPTPTPAVAHEPPPSIRLGITADGVYEWNGRPLADIAELESRLHELAADAAPAELHIRPVKQSYYRYTAAALAVAQREGLTKLAIVDAQD
jgi:biopolymer transport protein ExbD